MSSPETERVLKVRSAGLVSYIDIRPPLDTLEQYQDVYGTAHDLDYDKVTKPTERDFERSLFVGVTEFVFAGRTEAVLQEIAQRMIGVLAENHQIPASLQNVPAR